MAEFRGWAEAMVEGAQRAGLEPAVVHEMAQVGCSYPGAAASRHIADQSLTVAPSAYLLDR